MHQIPVFQIWPEPSMAGFGTEDGARFGNCGLQMECGCIKSDQTKLWTPALLICHQQKQNMENVL